LVDWHALVVPRIRSRDESLAVGGASVHDRAEAMSAGNATLPPMQYVDPNGDVIGMRIDLGKEISKRLFLTPKFVTSSSGRRSPFCKRAGGT